MPWPSKDPQAYSKPGRWEGRSAPPWLRKLKRLLVNPDQPPFPYLAGAVVIGLVFGVSIASATGIEWLWTAAIFLSRLPVDLWWWRKRRAQRTAG